MNNLSYKIGYWSAISLTVAFVVWIISFTGIALTSPLFYWTNPADYIVHVRENGRFFQNLAYLFMLLSGPLYVLLINGYYEYAGESERVLVRIGLIFGLAFALLSSLNYFVQLTSVRLNIIHENFSGIEYFTQANPNSLMTAAVMLGWTLFLGLSSLFIFPVFKTGRPARILRFAFLFNGFSCLMAGVGYIFQVDALTFLFTNIGTGGALMVISISSIRLFRRSILSQ